MLRIAALSIVLFSVSARAEDLTGRFGVGGAFGAAAPIGSTSLTDRNGIGPALGGWAALGVNSRWTARVSYDNFDLGRGHARFQPIEFGAGYLLCDKSAWNPTLRAGIGPWLQQRFTTQSMAAVFGFGAGFSLDRFLTKNFSVGAALDYYASLRQKPESRDAHILRPAVTLGFWFGGEEAAPAVAEAPRPAPTPAPAPAPAAAPSPAPKKVEIALNVEFETDKDVVRPQYDGELAKVAEFMKAHPAATAEIEGHTDNAGGAEYNRGLSQRRADAVRQALIERFKLDGSRLTAKGYGEERPIADNGTAEGRAKNRRVVATFSAVE